MPRPRGNKKTASSSSTSRQSPAGASDCSSLALPPPLSTRNLRPRVTRSQASSRRGSHSISNSRSSSVFSTVFGDAERAKDRERKRVKTGIVEAQGSGAVPSGSHQDTAPRPDWRTSEGYDDEEGQDQLVDSDVEDSRHLDQDSIQRGAAAQIHSKAGPSTRHQPLTAPLPVPPSSSADDDVEMISATFSRTPALGISGRSSPGSLHNQILRETPASPVSSASLMKIINQTNVEPGTRPPKRKRASSNSPDSEIIEISPLPAKDKGKGKAKALPSPSPTPPPPTAAQPKAPETEPLSEYTCPICFFPPSNATLTPCGHVCCGSCLFTAVKTTLQRGANMGMMIGVGENVARCPVCRAVIPGWDGRGGGVIGIKVRQVINL